MRFFNILIKVKVLIKNEIQYYFLICLAHEKFDHDHDPELFFSLICRIYTKMASNQLNLI